MALETLGNKYCIQSLRQDVTDLQETVIDVFSRVGPIRSQSWKYPDKMSCDVDITDMLDVYDYSDDTEERQVAHVVLLEMVIDRLILLVQGMAKFQDNAVHNMQETRDSKSATQFSSSVGLSVKYFWNKLVHLNTVSKKIAAEHKTCGRQLTDFNNNLTKVTEERDEFEHQVTVLMDSLRAANSPYPLSDGEVLKLVAKHTPQKPISKNENYKASQTIETAFVPCESCHTVQEQYRHFGDIVIDVCNSQKLPSSLRSYRRKMADVSWMSGTDVIRWSKELERDVEVVQEHLSEFDEVRQKLAKEKKNVKELKGKIAQLQNEIKAEKDTQNIQRHHFEEKLKIQDVKNADAVKEVENERDGLATKRCLLEEQLKQFKEQLQKQEGIMEQLGQANEKLELDLKSTSTTAEKVGTLEGEIENLERNLRNVDSELSQAREEYARERALKDSINTHHQATQAKQQSILDRLNTLDEENEQFRCDVAELEETKEKLEESLKQVQQEKEKLEQASKKSESLVMELKAEKQKLQESMSSLKSEISSLETQLRDARERERLLVENPDQSAPIHTTSETTTDIVTDMENQIQANSLRIQTLEKQNTKLRRCVDKILETRGGQQAPAGAPARAPAAAPGTASSKPVQLWNNFSDQESTQYRLQFSPPDYPAGPTVSPEFGRSGSRALSSAKPPTSSTKHKNALAEIYAITGQTRVDQSVLVGRGWTPSKGTTPTPTVKGSSKTRPHSGKPVKDSEALKAYKQIRKNGPVPVGSDGAVSHRRGPTGDPGTLTCPRCDKLYHEQKDLNIHMSYCRR